MSTQEPSIDPFAPSSPEERYQAFAQLRERAGVHKLPTGQWLALSYAAVEKGLKSVEHFVGSFGDTGDLPEERQILAAIPEPRHGRIRRIVNSVFAYHHSSKVEPFARDLASGLVDALIAESCSAGSVCLMQRYARPIPSAVIAHLIGVPSHDFETFGRWSDEVLERQSQDGAANRPLLEIHPEFDAYLKEQVAMRLGAPNPPDDLTTRLLHAEVEGEQLTETAVRTQLMFLIMAGNETTRNLIGNILKRLAESPELYAALRSDLSGLDAVIEETLRLDSPVQLLARTCTKPIELDGVQIEVGDRVLFSVASADRDAARFSAADEFRLDRERAREHLGFGAGPHVCPGAFLARMETTVALEVFIERVSAFHLAPGEPPSENPVFWAHGPLTLRVVVEEA